MRKVNTVEIGWDDLERVRQRVQFAAYVAAHAFGESPMVRDLREADAVLCRALYGEEE